MENNNGLDDEANRNQRLEDESGLMDVD
jgi:hypothetical protein